MSALSKGESRNTPPESSTPPHVRIAELEQQLREAKERCTSMEAAAEGTGIGSWEWEIDSGAIRVDERWAAIVGLSLDELGPLHISTWEKLTHPDDLPLALSSLQAHLNGESPRYEAEFRMRHKNGHWVWVLDRGKLFEFDEAGRPRRMAGSHQDISARKESEGVLARTRDYERLVEELSDAFVSPKYADTEAMIQATLGLIGDFVKADRSYIFQFSDGMRIMDNTHEWCAEGIEPQRENLQGIETEPFTWWMEKIRSNEIILLPDIAEIPDDNAALREILEAQDIISLIVIPLFSEGRPFGYIGFDAVRQKMEWPGETISLLRLAGGIIANALQRERADLLVQEELELALRLNASTAFEETLRDCLQAAMAISGMDCGGIYLLDRAERCMRLAYHEGLSADFVEEATTYPFDSSQVRMVLEGTPLYSEYDRLPVPEKRRLNIEGLKAIAVLPILCKGEVVAALNVASHSVRQIAEFPRKGLESITAHIGAAIMQARNEESIAAAKTNLELLFDTIDDFIFIIDTQGQVVHMNASGLKRLGYRADDALGRNVLDFHPPDRREEAQAKVEGMLAGTEESCMVPLLTRSGSLIPVETRVNKGIWDNQPMLFGISRDISELKKAEEALRNAEIQERMAREIRSLIDNIPGVVYRINPQGQLTLLSMPGEFDGEFDAEGIFTTRSCIHPDDRPGVLAADRALRSGKESHTLTYRLISKSGEERWVEDRKSSLFSPDGSFSGIDGILFDISDKIAIQEEKVALESRLRTSQRLETIGTLAGGIAHDFNNILTPLLGYAELGALAVEKENPIHEYFTEIVQAAERAKNLVTQILTFSRAQESVSSVVDLEAIVDEALKLLRPSIPSTITIRQRRKNCCGTIEADPSQIHQVIVNLCTNAFQAMEADGGTLTIDLEEVEADEALLKRTPALQSGRHIRMSITDTGQGMDAVTRERIFEPFFTTKSVNKGTGLGLSVVHGIVTSCKGEITVESCKGKGTTFHVYLPLSDRTAETPAVGEIKGGDKARILFVDDEQASLQMMQAMMAQLGYDITTFTSPLAALEWSHQHLHEVDLLITDLTMPEMTGIELARNLHAERPELPALLMTGYLKEVEQSYPLERYGILKFLKKPVRMAQLSDTINDILTRTKTAEP